MPSNLAQDATLSVVVTGASTGIGFATVKVLARAGYRVFGTVRLKEDAARLETELGCRALFLDVTEGWQIEDAVQKVSAELAGQKLAALVNNAGICVAGPLAYLPIERFRDQLEVNLTGVFAVTQGFLPLLGLDPARRGVPGKVVNVSSVSGRIAVPFLGAYAASKFGLEGMSDSLRRELRRFQIPVTIIQPGAVITPIWEKGEGRMVHDFPDTLFDEPLRRFSQLAMEEGKNGFLPERVGNLILRVLRERRPAPRYSIVPKSLMEWSIPRRLPDRVLDYFIDRAFRITPRTNSPPRSP